MNAEQYNAVIDILKKQEYQNCGAHDVEHAIRVYNLAKLIISKQEAKVNETVVLLAALLHDLADHKFGYSTEQQTEIISNTLINLNYSQDVVSGVTYIAATISFSGKKIPTTLEGQIVQDADRLDAIGAVGIGRVFSYNGKIGKKMSGPDSAIQHFYDKLFKLKDLMNTDTAKQIAVERNQYMIEFVKRFDMEEKGEI
ncbi:HD_domain-containing protein [Hexamita inflata]|uniref:HD domain-containing protein n=1 Tax=Hexamita inflata TaxID=28002 RepID=A0AA86RIC2_9EUKA|nr:HD domain-containing protein [Hexamita inflata]CAI9977092.1 HD domain-containing protein [Hexamita inflata]